MNKRHADNDQQVLAGKLSRRTILVGLAGGGVATARTLSGVSSPPRAGASPSPVASPGVARSPAGRDRDPVGYVGNAAHLRNRCSRLFYAFGWAQAHNHGDLLLQLYAQARGRGSRDLRRSSSWNGIGLPEPWGSTSGERPGVQSKLKISAPTSTPLRPGSMPMPGNTLTGWTPWRSWCSRLCHPMC